MAVHREIKREILNSEFSEEIPEVEFDLSILFSQNEILETISKEGNDPSSKKRKDASVNHRDVSPKDVVFGPNEKGEPNARLFVRDANDPSKGRVYVLHKGSKVRGRRTYNCVRCKPFRYPTFYIHVVHGFQEGPESMHRPTCEPVPFEILMQQNEENIARFRKNRAQSERPTNRNNHSNSLLNELRAHLSMHLPSDVHSSPELPASTPRTVRFVDENSSSSRPRRNVNPPARISEYDTTYSTPSPPNGTRTNAQLRNIVPTVPTPSSQGNDLHNTRMSMPPLSIQEKLSEVDMKAKDNNYARGRKPDFKSMKVIDQKMFVLSDENLDQNTKLFVLTSPGIGNEYVYGRFTDGYLLFHCTFCMQLSKGRNKSKAWIQTHQDGSYEVRIGPHYNTCYSYKLNLPSVSNENPYILESSDLSNVTNIETLACPTPRASKKIATATPTPKNVARPAIPSTKAAQTPVFSNDILANVNENDVHPDPEPTEEIRRPNELHLSPSRSTRSHGLSTSFALSIDRSDPLIKRRRAQTVALEGEPINKQMRASSVVPQPAIFASSGDGQPQIANIPANSTRSQPKNNTTEIPGEAQTSEGGSLPSANSPTLAALPNRLDLVARSHVLTEEDKELLACIPSTVDIRRVLELLNINVGARLASSKYWSNCVNIEFFDHRYRPTQTGELSSPKHSGFRCLSLFFTGTEDYYDHLQELVKNYYFDKCKKETVFPVTDEVRQNLIASDLTIDQLVCFADILPLRIVLFTEGQVQVFGEYANDYLGTVFLCKTPKSYLPVFNIDI